MLSLGSCASGVRTVSVARELNLLIGRQLQDFLETSANVHEDILALLAAAALTTSNVTVTASRNALSYGASPDADSEKGLSDVDDNAHDLTILLILKGLANSAHHDLEPETIDIDVSLVLVLVGPLAAVLVLGVFPLGSDTGFEKVVIGLERKFGNGSDVVLLLLEGLSNRPYPRETYVNSPKLLNRVESDDLLQKIIPVVPLHRD